MTNIILVRHGQTEWNRIGRLQGHIDIDLSEAGLTQARLLAERLAAEQRAGAHFAACYSSDLSRARQTAELLSQALDLPLQTIAQLRERNYGVFEGHDHAQIRARFTDAYLAWQQRDPDFAPLNGESQRDFYQRVTSTLTRLAGAHSGQRIICVVHGGVLDCAYRYALAMPLHLPRAHVLLNASLNELRYDGARAQIVDWADIAHLEASNDDDLGDKATIL